MRHGGRIFLAVCLVASVWLVPAVASAQSSDAVARGKQLYADQKCGVCHAVAGVGNRRGALDDVGARLSEEDLRAWIVDAPGMTKKTNAERKPPMRSYATLAPADVDALVAYMRSLKP